MILLAAGCISTCSPGKPLCSGSKRAKSATFSFEANADAVNRTSAGSLRVDMKFELTDLLGARNAVRARKVQLSSTSANTLFCVQRQRDLSASLFCTTCPAPGRWGNQATRMALHLE